MMLHFTEDWIDWKFAGVENMWPLCKHGQMHVKNRVCDRIWYLHMCCYVYMYMHMCACVCVCICKCVCVRVSMYVVKFTSIASIYFWLVHAKPPTYHHSLPFILNFIDATETANHSTTFAHHKGYVWHLFLTNTLHPFLYCQSSHTHPWITHHSVCLSVSPSISYPLPQSLFITFPSSPTRSSSPLPIALPFTCTPIKIPISDRWTLNLLTVYKSILYDNAPMKCTQ